MNKLWEFTGGVRDYCVYVPPLAEDTLLDWSATNGKAKSWMIRPCIEIFVDPHSAIQQPQADIGHLRAGSIILNEKAYGALGQFFQNFGQLLSVDCHGQVRYFYNITNLISVIDFDASEKIETAVIRPVFQEDKIPIDAQIFKDPLMANTRMFITQAAKDILEKVVEDHALTGLTFYDAGVKYYRRTH